MLFFASKANVPNYSDEQCYKEAIQQLNKAHNVFDEVTEPTLVEEAIHQVIAAELRVSHFYEKLRISR